MVGATLFDSRFLWDCAWQSTLFLALGLAGSRIWNERPVRAHAVLFLGLAAALAAPLASQVVRHLQGSFAGTMSGPGYAAAWLWMGLSAVLWVRLTVSWWAGARLLRGARPLADPGMLQTTERVKTGLGLKSHPMAFVSEAIRCPVIWCWRLHPALLLPEDAPEKVASPAWAGILTHELAHLKRKDYAAALFAEAVVCLFPWHPLAWWARARLDALSEEACDDWVIERGCEAPPYANALVDFVALRRLPLTPGAVSRGGHLRRRIERLISHRGTRPEAGKGWTRAVTTAAVGMVALVAAAQEPVAPPARSVAASHEDTASDVADVPSEERHAEGDPDKAYLLIAPRRAAEKPRGLVVVLPGGDGSRDFHPFVKRISNHALDEAFLVAQPIAKAWTPGQFDRVVWPTRFDSVEAARFTTEEFVRSVVADVASRYPVDPERVYVLAWSSGGPAAYASVLEPESPVRGAVVAMSVFRPACVEKGNVAGRNIAILHSPEDALIPLSAARKARETLEQAGARVRLTEYAGGHGWHGGVYELIRESVDWLADADATNSEEH